MSVVVSLVVSRICAALIVCLPLPPLQRRFGLVFAVPVFLEAFPAEERSFFSAELNYQRQGCKLRGETFHTLRVTIKARYACACKPYKRLDRRTLGMHSADAQSRE